MQYFCLLFRELLLSPGDQRYEWLAFNSAYQHIHNTRLSWNLKFQLCYAATVRCEIMVVTLLTVAGQASNIQYFDTSGDFEVLS